MLWARAAKKSGPAAGRSSTTRLRDVVGSSRRIAVNTSQQRSPRKSSNKGKPEGRGGESSRTDTCSCRECKQTRMSGRSCGKVQVRPLIEGESCVTIYSPEPLTASEWWFLPCFRWVH